MQVQVVYEVCPVNDKWVLRKTVIKHFWFIRRIWGYKEQEVTFLTPKSNGKVYEFSAVNHVMDHCFFTSYEQAEKERDEYKLVVQKLVQLGAQKAL